ncbi:MAG: hypothetical protein ACI9OJ_002355, partial [Myxococcota bacterium]
RKALFLIGSLSLVAAIGCQSSNEGSGVDGVTGSEGATGTDGTEPVQPIGPVDPALLSEKEIEFKKQFQAVIDEAAVMTVPEAMAAYESSTPPVGALGYDPLVAGSMDLIDDTLALTETENAQLSKSGFAVSGRLSFDTFAESYTHVYNNDLPLFITTDSVLHAVHMSFDRILSIVETQALVPQMNDVLSKAHGALEGVGASQLGEATRDADLFLTVARSLLAGEPVASVSGGPVDDEVAALLSKITEERLENIMIFGQGRKVDFSQFKPRGHYTETEVLQRWFKTMIWLARIDLRFREFDPFTETFIWNDRQIQVSWLLFKALEEGSAINGWGDINTLIGLLIGESDAMDMSHYPQLIAEAGINSADDLTGDLTALHTKLEEGRYGTQRINSHYLSTNPLSAEVTPLPLSFTFIGQRFVVDSHTFSNVVYDRIAVNGSKPLRALPSPLDAMFVLGADQALPLLADELDAWSYQGNLHTMRWLTDQYDETFWDNSQYNLWLSALRTLNVSTTDESWPASMRTEAWSHKTLNTQLSSWAQLRHDTILYVKQSYTGGVGCDYPKAYVEPYPAFYSALGRYSDTAAQVLGGVQFTEPAMGKHVAEYFKTFSEIMGHLEGMANAELADEPFTDEQQEMADAWIDMFPGCGDPTYEGWYTRLYFEQEQVKAIDYTVADVHTNPNEDGPLAPARVLHVGTGRTNLMIFTRNSCDGSQAYVGPVMNYYEHIEMGVNRLNDEEWELKMNSDTPPVRPAWTSSYFVPASIDAQ